MKTKCKPNSARWPAALRRYTRASCSLSIGSLLEFLPARGPAGSKPTKGKRREPRGLKWCFRLVQEPGQARAHSGLGATSSRQPWCVGLGFPINTDPLPGASGPRTSETQPTEMTWDARPHGPDEQKGPFNDTCTHPKPNRPGGPLPAHPTPEPGNHFLNMKTGPLSCEIKPEAAFLSQVGDLEALWVEQ